jgi:soluble lytic murein transglycosylase-like protein
VNAALIAVGLLLAVGIWGYVTQGNPFAVVNQVMGNLSASDIAGYASGAGFSPDLVPTMTAIALAESSGNPNAVGDNGTSYGLWQIHFTVHPEVLNGQDPSILFDPATNANAAYQIFQRQGLSAWTTYNTGTYAKNLPAAQAAVGA